MENTHSLPPQYDQPHAIRTRRGQSRILALILTLISFPNCAHAQVAGYNYDALGRLTRVCTGGGSSANVDYAYDLAGNRRNVTVKTRMGSVINASFEQPSAGGGYIYNPSAPDMTFSGFAGVAANGSDWGFQSAPNGQQVAFIRGDLGSRGSITFSAGGLQAGKSYQVSFAIAQRPGYGVNPVTATSDGTVLGTFVPPSTEFRFVRTATFVASATTAQIELAGAISSIDIGAGIDQVSVVEACSSPAIVTNGSFEAPGVGTGYAYNPMAPSVTFQGLSGVAANGSDWGFSNAPDGMQVAFLRGDHGGGASFDVHVTNLQVGRSYHVRFLIARRPNYGLNPVSVSVSGVILGTYRPASATFMAIDTPEFIASAAEMALTFSGISSSTDIGSGIDSVEVR